MSSTGSAYYKGTSEHSLDNRVSVGAYLAQAGREDDDLVDFTHLLQKVVYSWALDDIDVVPLPFNLHRHDVVRLGDELATEQNQILKKMGKDP